MDKNLKVGLGAVAVLIALGASILAVSWQHTTKKPVQPEPMVPKVELAKIYLLGRFLAKEEQERPDLHDAAPSDGDIRNMLVFWYNYRECLDSPTSDDVRVCAEMIQVEEVELVRRAWTDEEKFVVEVLE